MAPGVPAERVAALRQAFLAVMQDAEFVAEARRIKLDVIYTAGEALQAKLDRIYASPPDLVARVRRAIETKD